MMANLPTPILEEKAFGDLNVLTDEELFCAHGVRVAFTGRHGGVSKGCYASLNTADHVKDDPKAVAANRRIALDSLGIAEELTVVPLQVHGTDIVSVREGDAASETLARAREGADIVLVERPHVVTFLHAADCLLLVAVSPTGRYVAAHAGWRGAVAGIAGKAVRALAQADATGNSRGFESCVTNALDSEGSASSSYNVYISPHIGPECFEVGPEVIDQFVAVFGDDVVVDDRHIDLARAVTIDLVRAGIAESRIAYANICTKCHPESYFSYRASGGACGRHAAIAYSAGA